jgi:polysaccharide biosynthesis/export protein
MLNSFFRISELCITSKLSQALPPLFGRNTLCGSVYPGWWLSTFVDELNSTDFYNGNRVESWDHTIRNFQALLYNMKDAPSACPAAKRGYLVQRSRMRTAILCALLGSASVYLAAQPAQQPPQPPPARQSGAAPDQQKPAPQSLSPLVPVPDPSKLLPADSGAKPPAAPVDAKSYVIGAEDELSINVFENQGFNVPLETVRPDGKITMPLIGELAAAGKTPEQLKAEITEVLATNYMNLPPHVSVIVVKVLSKNIYLNGEVNKPGKYPLVVPTTVMQALVNAGGFRDFANKKKIRIQRGTKFFNFNYNEVSKGKKLDQNILLQPDDQIYVN